jgi:vitamin B12 transporter
MKKSVLGVFLYSASLMSLAVELEPLVVTASRSAQSLEDVLASVSVISREDIARQQAQSLHDVLRGLAGVNLSDSGNTSLFLRGTNAGHVLVLLNGVKVGSATAGTTAFSQIPIEQIDRIEVVRGPRSSLYGSEAIGGVIQIFTRKPTSVSSAFFSFGAGSEHTYRLNNGFSLGFSQGWLSAQVGAANSVGFNRCRGSETAGCFTVEPDQDGYDQQSWTLQGGHRFSNGLEIETQLLRTRDQSEFDGSFQNRAKTLQQVFGQKLSYDVSDNWKLDLSIGQSRDQSDNFKDEVFISQFDTQRDHVVLQSDHLLNDNHSIIAGLDYQQDAVDSSTNYSDTSRENTGVFLQYQVGLGNNDWQFAIRQDDNEQFGQQKTGTMAWGYRVIPSLRIVSEYGTAFKAPTFNDLFYPGFSNPNLTPETSESVDVALKGWANWGHWDVTAYHTDIDQLIALDASFKPDNLNRVRIRGVDSRVSAHFGEDWHFVGNLSWLDTENQSEANKGNELPRRPSLSSRIDLDRNMGQYQWGATLVANGDNYDDLANTQRLTGYATLDLRGAYLPSKEWQLQMRIANLLDKTYETVAFYTQPSRGVFLTISFNTKDQ